MADVIRVIWPTASWFALKRIIRAWYAVSGGTKDVKQKEIASVAGVQATRLSMNKPFLQAIGIIETDGSKLTEEGQRLGLGLTQDNTVLTIEGLVYLVRKNPLLKQLFDTITGRGVVDKETFAALVIQITKLGKDSDNFSTGVNVLADLLSESTLIQTTDKGFRAAGREAHQEGQPSSPQKQTQADYARFHKIPIAVSAANVWYIEVPKEFEAEEIERFIEMQRLIFGLKKVGKD